MKNFFSTITILLIFLSASAQNNLVLNPGFEKGYRQKNGSYEAGGHGYLADNWHSPLKHSPQLFVRPKRSVAVARNGRAAIGIMMGSGRQEKTKFQYITGRLSKPLEKGKVYCVSFNTILQRTSRWSATDFGVLIHHDRDIIKDISDPTTLAASLYAEGGDPVTVTGWREYNGYYVASGGEKYITFGKFGKSESVKMSDQGFEPYYEVDGFQGKAYYQLDDIGVKELKDSMDCGCAEDFPDLDEPKKEVEVPPFLFALDVSSSMRKNDLFDRLRTSLTELITMLPQGSPVSFITFSSGARKLFVGNVDGNTSAYIDSVLLKNGLSGGTNVFAGLNLSYGSRITTTPDSARMVLISDGSFTVTKKIEALVKKEYETSGRKLTVVQIESRANGAEKLLPYEASFINTTPSEISSTIAQLYRYEGERGPAAVDCDCDEEFSDTVNYHFVIDYSGSMAQEKGRAISALKYLFEKAPDNAMMSITSFNTTSEELYVGRKSDITMEELSRMLRRERTGGGTDPMPGVRDGLRLAKRMADGRFSNLIIITDYSADQLTKLRGMGSTLQSNIYDFPLAANAIKVTAGGSTYYSQFDVTRKEFLGVNKQKFEEDLFYAIRSSCDYTSTQYHYNPAKAYLKKEGEKLLKNVFQSLLEESLK